MYHYGLSSDTPNFIIDNLEDGYDTQDFQESWSKSTSTTDAVRYQPIQWEPNENGRGSLLNKDDDEEKQDANGRYRIRSYWADEGMSMMLMVAWGMRYKRFVFGSNKTNQDWIVRAIRSSDARLFVPFKLAFPLKWYLFRIEDSISRDAEFENNNMHTF